MRYAGYPENQDSNIEWIGRIPAHWSVHRLKWSVLDCTNGVWGEEADGVDDIVCLRVADFDRDKFTITPDNLTIRAVDPKQLESRKLKKGDLLIEKSGGGEKQLVGCVVYFDLDFDAVSSNFVARMTVDPALSARYICYLHAGLYAGKLNYPAIKQTTGIQNLDTNEYLNTLVAYPPTVEQEQIAAFLDWKTGQIDALIAKKKELLEKLKEKRLAVITQAVTKGINPSVPLRDSGIPWLGQVPKHWEVKKLKFIGDSIIGLTYDPNEITDEQNGTLVLRANNIQDGKLVANDALYVSTESPEKLRLRTGDILICSRNGSRHLIGKCGRVTPEFVGCYFGAFNTVFRSNAADYIYYVLNSSLFEYQSGSYLTSTINQLTIGTLNSFVVPLPPPVEQEKIVEFLEAKMTKLNDLASNAQSVVDRLTEYRTALITAATTGKIDVRNVKIGAVA